MNWKQVTGWTFLLNAFVSIVFIIYLNMNFGWFYPYRDTSMLIPTLLTVISFIFIFSSIEINDSWEWLGDAYDY